MAFSSAKEFKSKICLDAYKKHVFLFEKDKKSQKLHSYMKSLLAIKSKNQKSQLFIECWWILQNENSSMPDKRTALGVS